jgi:drug/metabolite transporter superfamily protein YnfA
MKSLLWYLLASLGEIAGCFSFWAWLRMGKNPLWVIPHLQAGLMPHTAGFTFCLRCSGFGVWSTPARTSGTLEALPYA